jgi:hypothetical protein
MNERDQEIRALRRGVNDLAGQVARLSERLARLEAEPAAPAEQRQAPSPRAPGSAGLFLTMAVAIGDATLGASLTACLAVLAVALVSEPREMLAARAWAPLRHPAVAAGVYLVAAWMIGWTVMETLGAALAAGVLIGLAALAGLLVLRLRPLPMSLAHLLLLLFALLFWAAHDREFGVIAHHALAWAAIALPFALGPLMRAGSGVFRFVPATGTTAAWLLALTAYPDDVIAAGWLPAYWTALAIALVTYHLAGRAPHAAWIGAFSLGLATVAGRAPERPGSPPRCSRCCRCVSTRSSRTTCRWRGVWSASRCSPWPSPPRATPIATPDSPFWPSLWPSSPASSSWRTSTSS